MSLAMVRRGVNDWQLTAGSLGELYTTPSQVRRHLYLCAVCRQTTGQCLWVNDMPRDVACVFDYGATCQ